MHFFERASASIRRNVLQNLDTRDAVEAPRFKRDSCSRGRADVGNWHSLPRDVDS